MQCRNGDVRGVGNNINMVYLRIKMYICRKLQTKKKGLKVQN